MMLSNSTNSIKGICNVVGSVPMPGAGFRTNSPFVTAQLCNVTDPIWVNIATHCGHSDMNLGFSEPDSHEELQFGNNTPY